MPVDFPGELKQSIFGAPAQQRVDLIIKDSTGELKAFEIKWSGGRVTKSLLLNIPRQLIHKDNFTDYFCSRRKLEYFLQKSRLESREDTVESEALISPEKKSDSE